MARKIRHVTGQSYEQWRQGRTRRAENPNWRPCLLYLARWLMQKFDSHFDQQGVGARGATQTWQPRKHHYYWNGEKLPKRPVLIRSGKMRRSMAVHLHKDQMEFYFEVDYWQYHEFGEGRMKRRVFVITDEYADVIVNTLAYYRITGEIKVIING